MTAQAERISPDQARQHLESGAALLVCAYDDDAKCAQNHLAGAITLREFEARVGTLSRGREIIFYCA